MASYVSNLLDGFPVVGETGAVLRKARKPVCGIKMHFHKNQIVFGEKRTHVSVAQGKREALLYKYANRPFDYLMDYRRVIEGFSLDYVKNLSIKLHRGVYFTLLKQFQKKIAALPTIKLEKKQMAYRSKPKFSFLDYNFEDEMKPADEVSSACECMGRAPLKVRAGPWDHLTDLEFLDLYRRYGPDDVVAEIAPVKRRSVMLARKLRAVICSFGEVRKTTKFSRPSRSAIARQDTRPRYFVKCSDAYMYNQLVTKFPHVKFINQIKILPEMEGAHGATDNQIICSQNSNYIIESQRLASQGIAKIRQGTQLLAASAGVVQQHYKDITDRWIALDTFEWKGDQARGSFIKSYTLPAALNSLRSSSVNAMPFNLATYWNGDIEIKIEVASNKFQVGQLQFAWLYEPAADKNIAYRTNIYSLSQTNHCIINAGSSNSGYLKIPYVHPKSALPTFTTSLNARCLELGKLYVGVLNPLTTPDGVAKVCDVTIFISLPSSSYMGMKDSKVGEFIYPEMESVAAVGAVVAAEKLLNNVLSDNNRDNPPYQQARTVMVPQSNQSFCVGDNAVEPINPMRLDARGQTPCHLTGQDEMKISHVAGVYGLTGHLSWTADFEMGKLLATYDASPLWDEGKYNGITLNTDKVYYLPPVAILSALFAYWSGELSLRLDVVASQFHTGRILVAYVPLYEGELTLEQAQSYPCQTYDLKEAQQFLFTIPYVADVPLWPRRIGYTKSDDKFIPPGRVMIFVQQRLIPMDNVAKEVEINVYWAGKESFEVAVPAAPSLASCFFTANDQPTTAIKAKEGYYPFYAGFSSDYVNYMPMNTHWSVIRYGPMFDHFAQFINIKKNKYYKVNVNNLTNITFKAWHPDTKKEARFEFDKLYFFGVDLMDGYGTVYMAYTIDKAHVDKCVRDPIKNRWWDLSIVPNDDDCPYTNGNVVFDEFDIDGFELINHEMEERQVGGPDAEIYGTCKVEPAPSRMGMAMFGEKFTDLKTLCRRYQPYGSTVMAGTKTNGDVAFSFPAMPQGLDIDLATKSSYYGKYCRDGTIPLILSGYRYFTGGLRYQIVTVDQGLTMWIQHRPDYEGAPKVAIIGGAVNTAEQLINSGYASYIQSTKVNNVIGFEIPFYKPRACTFLQRHNLKHESVLGAMHLGQIYVGLEGLQEKKSAGVNIFYSLADDARAHVFQGFPGMVILDNIPKSVTETGTLRHRINFEMFSPNITIKADIGDNINAHLSRIADGLSAMPEKLDTLTDKMGFFKSNVQSVMLDFLGHIGHVLLTPSKTHIAWALAHLFVKFGIVNMENFHSTVLAIKPCVSQIFTDTAEVVAPLEPTSGQQLEDEEPQPIELERPSTPIFEDVINFEAPLSSTGAAMSIVSLMFTLINGMCNMSVKPPKNLLVFTKDLLNGVTGMAKDQNNLIKFFKNNVEVCKSVMEYFTLWNNKAAIFERMMLHDLPMISEWFEEVEFLTDIKRDEETYALNSRFATRIEEAYLIGSNFGKYLCLHYESLEAGPNKEEFFKVYQIFKESFKSLAMKRNNMHRRGLSAVSRREPYTVWVEGSPGIGKSVLVQKLIPSMLQYYRISYKGEPIFTLPSGAAYWTGCRSQPCILIDDFLCVNSGELRDAAIRDLFALKSPAVLNPPMAALEDKELRYCPELAVICSNYAFPRTGIANDQAVWRRRDILLRVQLKQELLNMGTMASNHGAIAEKCQELGWQLSEMDHLDFWIAKDVANEQTKYDGPYSYAVARQKILVKGNQYRAHQQELYDERVLALEQNFHGDDDEITVSLREKLDEFKNACRFMSVREPNLNKITHKEFIQIAFDYARTGQISPDKTDFINKVRIRTVAAVHADEGIVPNCLLDCRDHCALQNFVSPPMVISEDLTAENIKASLNEFMVTLEGGAPARVFFGSWIPQTQDSIRLLNIIFKALKEVAPERSLSTVSHKVYMFTIELGENCLKRYVVSARLQGADEGVAGRVRQLSVRMPCGQIYTKCKCRSCWTALRTKLRGEALEATLAFECKCFMLTSNFYYDNLVSLFCNPDVEGEVATISLNGCCRGCEMSRFPDVKNRMINKWISKNPSMVRLNCFPPGFMNDTKVNRVYYLLKEIINKSYSSVTDFWVKYLHPTLSIVWRIFIKILPWLALAGVVSYLFFPTANPGEVVMRGVSAGIISMASNLPVEESRDYVTPVDLDHVLMPSLEPESRVYDGSRPIRPSRGTRPALRSVARLESALFNDQIDIVLRRLHKNSYVLTSGALTVRVLVLYENVILYLKHYHQAIVAGHEMPWRLVSCANPEIAYTVRPYDWQPRFMDSSAIGYVRVPNLVMHKSLLQFIAPQNLHSNRINEGLLFSPDTGSYSSVTTPVKKVNAINISELEDIEAQALDIAYRYPWHGAGRCGTVLLNTNLNKPILGIHVAGGGLYGYAEPIYSEMYTKWRAPMEVELPSKIVDDKISPKIQGEFVPIGRINSTLKHAESGKSRIIPSLAAGIFPIVSGPSVIAKGDPRMPDNYSPLYAGVNNMGRPPLSFEPYDVNTIRKFYQDRILATCRPTGRIQLYDLEDAISGIPGQKYYDGLEMNTSEGFPFSRYRPAGAKDKRWLFQLEGNPERCVGINQDLQDCIIREIADRSEGIKIPTIFDDCLKDARLPLNKVTVEGKTRIFSISPVQYTIVFKMYFFDFIAAFKANRLVMAHAIGINPDGPEWGDLVQNLTEQREDPYTGVKYKNKYLCGDYKNFGPSLAPDIVTAVINVILYWYDVHLKDTDYTDDEVATQQCVRRILLQELKEAYHLCHDSVYQTICGCPSGSPLTAELNSMVNEFYLLLAWRHIMYNDPFYNFFHSFYDTTCLYTYGDDLIMSVSEQVADQFNNKTLAAYFARHNIEYTDALKAGVMVPYYDKLSECTFLKRGFLPHPKFPGQYLAPLDLEFSVKDVANWCHTSLDIREATELSIEACCANAYSHGVNVHSTIRATCQQWLATNNYLKILRSWEEWDRIHYAIFYPDLKNDTPGVKQFISKFFKK